MCSFIAHRKKNISFYVPSYLLCIAAGTFTKQNKFLFLNCFYLVKHRYRLHLSFTHRVLVFQKASNSYKRNPLIFVFNLERKIIENQLCYIHKRGAHHEWQKQKRQIKKEIQCLHHKRIVSSLLLQSTIHSSLLSRYN